MKEKVTISLLIVVGLVLAYIASGPLRRPANDQPLVGTPLNAASGAAERQTHSPQVYAEGKVELAKEKVASAKGAQALFIIARTGMAGPPLAVLRVSPVPNFPFEFSLTEEHNMAGEGFYDGPITVIARLDMDGSAGAGPGDLEARVDVSSESGRRVNVVIGK